MFSNNSNYLYTLYYINNWSHIQIFCVSSFILNYVFKYLFFYVFVFYRCFKFIFKDDSVEIYGQYKMYFIIY